MLDYIMPAGDRCCGGREGIWYMYGEGGEVEICRLLGLIFSCEFDALIGCVNACFLDLGPSSHVSGVRSCPIPIAILISFPVHFV